MNYTKSELEQALTDFEEFIKITEVKGTPIRLKIVRDLLIKELENDN